MLSKANVRGLLAGLGLAVGLVATGSSCHQSIMTAPPGSTMGLIANPTFIPANGGVSVISAILYDGTGQPVPDGTVVQFFTTLGRIDPQARTNDGVAKANLVADGRSGVAKVSAEGGRVDAMPVDTPCRCQPPRDDAPACACTNGATVWIQTSSTSSKARSQGAVGLVRSRAGSRSGENIPEFYR